MLRRKYPCVSENNTIYLNSGQPSAITSFPEAYLSWGGQIDLLIDRADEVISICEIMYVSDKYVIDADYEKRLSSRATLFRQVTKTKKALHHAFITTYGVSKNSGIVQSEVTMEDLFK